jgi:hypothetical protein
MPYSKHEPERHFHSQLTADKFDRAFEEDHQLTDQGKSDFDNAPTADPVKEGAKHGIIMEHSYKILGNGRHQITVRHVDGHTWTSVQPEAFRAHELLTRAHGFDEQPPAIKTFARARAHPVGEREADRLAREDKREIRQEPSVEEGEVER